MTQDRRCRSATACSSLVRCHGFAFTVPVSEIPVQSIVQPPHPSCPGPTGAKASYLSAQVPGFHSCPGSRAERLLQINSWAFHFPCLTVSSPQGKRGKEDMPSQGHSRAGPSLCQTLPPLEPPMPGSLSTTSTTAPPQPTAHTLLWSQPPKNPTAASLGSTSARRPSDPRTPGLFATSATGQASQA